MGDCWEFGGSSGYLAISLSEGVHISMVSLDYFGSQPISTISVGMFPRNFVLWVLLPLTTPLPHVPSRPLSQFLQSPHLSNFSSSDRFFTVLNGTFNPTITPGHQNFHSVA